MRGDHMKTTEPSEGSGEFYRNTTKIPPPPPHRSLAYLSKKTGQTTLWTEKIAVRTVIEIRLTEHVYTKILKVVLTLTAE